MKIKLLTASLLAALLSTTALADTSSIQGSSHGLLENQWVKAGINKNTGTFGSGGGTSPGLLFDPTGTGTFNAGFDYLTPGSPFDGFSLKVDGVNATNNNIGTASFVDSDGLTDGNNTLTWSGDRAFGSATWNVTNTFTLGTTASFVDVTTTITAGSAASSVWFGKFIDPDSQGMAGDSSSTDNVLGYSGIPSTNVAFSEATVSRYALGLYSTDTNVAAGINGWNTDAASYINADASCGAGVLYCNADDTIGLSWNWVGVSAGDILTASYAYIFGPSAFDAADSAIIGGAGGGTPGVLPTGWTLTDVGSATDAASGGGTPPTPTVVSTTTATISSTTEAPSTTLPVLTASITTHDSSVTSGVQTIDRETTTSVTTPVNVTTTSFVRTTDTYSDSSVVVTDGAATSTVVVRNDVVVTVTNPGSFFARMDQANQLAELNVAHSLGFANGLGGGRISHSMGNGYSAETNVVGLGHTIVSQNGVEIKGGFNLAETTLTGANSTGSMGTTHFGIEVSKVLDDRDLVIGVAGNVANSDIGYTRTIGDFALAGKTTASDVWGTITVGKATGAVRPWAGYTIGQRNTDAWGEIGSIQAKLSTSAADTTYNYASLGLNVEAGILDLGISKSFDDADTTSLSVGIDKKINDRFTVGANANHKIASDNTSTFLSAGVSVKF